MLKDSKSGVIKNKSSGAHKQKLTLFLLLAGLVKSRKLWLARHGELFLLVELLVKLKSIIGVREVLCDLLLDFVLGFNPVRQFFRYWA